MKTTFALLVSILSITSAFADTQCDLNKIVENAMDVSHSMGSISNVNIQKMPRTDFTSATDGAVSVMRYSYTMRNTVMIGMLKFSQENCEQAKDEFFQSFHGARPTYKYVPNSNKSVEDFQGCNLKRIVEEQMDISSYMDPSMRDIRIQEMPRVDFVSPVDGNVSVMRYSYKTGKDILIGTLTFSIDKCEIVQDEMFNSFNGARSTYQYFPKFAF